MDTVTTASPKSAKKRSISLSAATTMRLVPHVYPFVLLDRVRACYAEEAHGFSVKNITMTDPVLSGHFPGHPIYPGVLIIEAMVQNACMTATTRDLYRHFGSYEALLEHFAKHPGSVPSVAKTYFLAESRVKHIQAVYPGDSMELEAQLILERDGMLVFKIAASVDGKEVAKGQCTMATALGDALKLSDTVS
jgi:3-hydroxyacyl-[acyl-carrier-protein] dehydratase